MYRRLWLVPVASNTQPSGAPGHLEKRQGEGIQVRQAGGSGCTAQSYHPCGTAAELTVVPRGADRRARIVGWRHRHRHGPQFRRPRASHRLGRDAGGRPRPARPGRANREFVGGWVDRIVEVSFSDNADLDAAVSKVGTVIAAYATRRKRPDSPSGRSCSTTSRSGCSAATISRSAPSGRPRPTHGSTPARVVGSCSRSGPEMEDTQVDRGQSGRATERPDKAAADASSAS